jgi:hypothetical protein
MSAKHNTLKLMAQLKEEANLRNSPKEYCVFVVALLK